MQGVRICGLVVCQRSRVDVTRWESHYNKMALQLVNMPSSQEADRRPDSPRLFELTWLPMDPTSTLTSIPLSSMSHR